MAWRRDAPDVGEGRLKRPKRPGHGIFPVESGQFPLRERKWRSSGVWGRFRGGGFSRAAQSQKKFWRFFYPWLYKGFFAFVVFGFVHTCLKAPHSRPICEVKRTWAQLVRAWGTSLESCGNEFIHDFFFPFFFRWVCVYAEWMGVRKVRVVPPLFMPSSLYARPSYNVCPSSPSSILCKHSKRYVWCPPLSHSMQGRRTTYVPSSSSSFYLMQAPLQNAPPLSHCTCPLVNAYINICIYCKLCTSIWTKHMDKTKTKEEKRINIKCICEKLTKSEKNKIK